MGFVHCQDTWQKNFFAWIFYEQSVGLDVINTGVEISNKVWLGIGGAGWAVAIEEIVFIPV
jgi:hypothetical protein